MKPEKQAIVNDLKVQVAQSPYVMLTDYSRLTVQNFTDLRKQLSTANAECHVVKNTLITRALEAAGLPKSDRPLDGMTALVIGSDKSEISAVAKILKKFGKDTEKSKVKLGFMGQTTLTADQVMELADLPSLNELRSKIIGLLQAPATKIAVIMGAPASKLARVVKAYADKPAAAQG
jgi:large subunit ribosomal protein L10